ncbi:Uncharacterised protein [Vibrio cholerae]|nr:Uncharacterised protein [Vibrio cholerae]
MPSSLKLSRILMPNESSPTQAPTYSYGYPLY